MYYKYQSRLICGICLSTKIIIKLNAKLVDLNNKKKIIFSIKHYGLYLQITETQHWNYSYKTLRIQNVWSTNFKFINDEPFVLRLYQKCAIPSNQCVCQAYDRLLECHLSTYAFMRTVTTFVGRTLNFRRFYKLFSVSYWHIPPVVEYHGVLNESAYFAYHLRVEALSTKRSKPSVVFTLHQQCNTVRLSCGIPTL